MKTVKVRGYEIGAGRTGIIVPIVGRTADEIIKTAKSFKGRDIDVVEWRADFYEKALNLEKVLQVLEKLRSALEDMPLLFTFRTKDEGGERVIASVPYTNMNKAVAESGYADIVDIEIFSGDDIARRNIDNVHNAGLPVIGSNHDFSSTPSKNDIVYRLRKMQDMGADIPKIAVMPNCKEDVLTLLAATNEMYEKYADRPIITMSMSSLGVISRISGGTFGSSMSFGAVGQGSAPGQLSADDLSRILDILHKAM